MHLRCPETTRKRDRAPWRLRDLRSLRLWPGRASVERRGTWSCPRGPWKPLVGRGKESSRGPERQGSMWVFGNTCLLCWTTRYHSHSLVPPTRPTESRQVQLTPWFFNDSSSSSPSQWNSPQHRLRVDSPLVFVIAMLLDSSCRASDPYVISRVRRDELSDGLGMSRWDMYKIV